MAGVTSGIEPIFDINYVRRSESLSESVFKVEHPLVAEYRKITESRKEDPLPSHFVTAHAIAAEKRVLMQAALQKHIDQAISSTINLPKDTPVETIENIYRMAWKQGLKGITVYREGSREGILLTEMQAKRQAVKVLPAQVTPRPMVLNGITTRERTPLGTAFITINYANGKPKDPFEVFVRLGKAGSDLEADAEAIGRLLSLILRLPSPMTREQRLREVIDQLEHIGGSRFTGFGPNRVRSMPDGIARASASPPPSPPRPRPPAARPPVPAPAGPRAPPPARARPPPPPPPAAPRPPPPPPAPAPPPPPRRAAPAPARRATRKKKKTGAKPLGGRSR